MVALVGRELYDSSKTKKLECPISCPIYGEVSMKSRLRNSTEWENGRCAKIEDNPSVAESIYGFEYTFVLREGVSCCTLEMLRYKNPFIIWVRLYKISISDSETLLNVV